MPVLSPYLKACLFPAVRNIAALLCVPLLVSVAHAADDADVQILGFSKAGDYFAFEQYGIQDGSGFPYSEIFVLDVIGDSWVKPSPFRRRDDINDRDVYDGDTFLSETRAKNRATAQPLLQSRKIAGKGKTVGFNPRTELTSDPHKMIVAPTNTYPFEDKPLELTLDEYPMSSSECANYGTETKGFRLTMKYQGIARTLHEDKSVPDSRICPHAYRIERIVTHFPEQAPPVFAILVQMESFGFEGSDRRYLAITGRL
ncbi:MAG: DUF2259 domain-containing protein [Roseibium sp.]|uniref:DUF2259 domain-containing protein n=1 Tax=Roseibium sp. TaxID=1936156 RepID=UPI00261F0D36|nr:DUF2259 domain-containing protein [Roseibium sp.]MCV0428995.1 DUF2259 domain-containing protein [Roseibium sp.]